MKVLKPSLLSADERPVAGSIYMNKRNLSALFLLLIGSVTTAAVYKWVDESGSIHYGDSPPPGRDSQSVEIPEGPSQKEVERAQQQMREKIEQHKKYSEEASQLVPLDEPPQEIDSRAVTPDNIACFTPLSDLIHGPSAETFTPITPTLLTKVQQALLKNLFGKADVNWRGTISDLQCKGSSSSPKESQVRNFEAQATLDWDARKSRLTIETDTIGKESGVTERLFHRFEVGDALYFTDLKTVSTMNLDGNKVELLKLSQNGMSFLIKQHIPTAAGARRPRGEFRHLEITDRSLKLIELYYYNGVFIDSRTWTLGR